MYEYKSEILKTGVNWFSDKAKESDVDQFTEFFNQKCTDGWELVTYSYMATSISVRGALLATFKRPKQ